MVLDGSLFIGIVASVILTTIGFFLKRVIVETDKLFREHQEKLRLLTESIAQLTKEQILITERLGRLITLDDKMIEHERNIFKLLEHEKQHRQRYHELANMVNNIIGMLAHHGYDTESVFKQKKWVE